MRRAMTVLCITAVVVLAASATWADSTGDFMFENYFNSSNDPHATTNGLIWIDTGNGVPFQTPNPVYYESNWPPPASDCVSGPQHRASGRDLAEQPRATLLRPQQRRRRPGLYYLPIEGHPL